MTWTPVCRLDDLDVERGAAAIVGSGQVAVFRLHDGSVHAVGNLDPFSGAQVLARGIVGTRGGTDFVASPMHKQGFDLRTGRCLDDPAIAVPVYAVRVVDGVVEVSP
ncbi:MAG: nitrite reductase small subunit NirD [Nocardioidaceae bacterium]